MLINKIGNSNFTEVNKLNLNFPTDLKLISPDFLNSNKNNELFTPAFSQGEGLNFSFESGVGAVNSLTASYLSDIKLIKPPPSIMVGIDLGANYFGSTFRNIDSLVRLLSKKPYYSSSLENNSTACPQPSIFYRESFGIGLDTDRYYIERLVNGELVKEFIFDSIRVIDVAPATEYDKVLFDKYEGECNIGEYSPRGRTTNFPNINDKVVHGELNLSDNADKRAMGIYDGFIVCDLTLFHSLYETSLNNDTGVCNASSVILDRQYNIKVKIFLESRAYIQYYTPRHLSIFKLDENLNPINEIFYGNIGETDSFKNSDAHVAQIPELGITELIYKVNNPSGVINESLEAYRLSWYVQEIYEGKTLIDKVFHYTPIYKIYSEQFPLGSPDIYSSDYSIKNFNSFLNSIDSFSLCYGVEFKNGIFSIPKFNLDGFSKLGRYEINAINFNYPSNGYFIFNNGLYSGLIDATNKIIYYILADGSGYYELNLNDLEILNFKALRGISFKDKYSMVLSLGNDYNLEHYFIKFKLIKFEIKPTKLVYDFNKISLTFIPCYTHCMGKGGITSKV